MPKSRVTPDRNPKPQAVTTDAKAPVAESMSPARRALAACVDALRRAEHLERSAREPVLRLQAQIDAELPLRAALNRLDAADADAMAAWAKTGEGSAPQPCLAERQKEAAALADMERAAAAARAALPEAERSAADARLKRDAARDRIRPAVAQVLREDGARLAAEYWRRMGELEYVRRELTALDQLLAADFPIVHEATGRTIVEWVSPDKLSAPEALHAAETACAGLSSIEDFVREWRIKGVDLMGGYQAD